MEAIAGRGCYTYGDAWAPGYPTPEYVSGYEIQNEGCGDLSLPVLSSLSMAEMKKQCLSQWYYYHNDDFMQDNFRQDEFLYQLSQGHGKFSSHHNLHPTTIARRNERERNRVKTINSTFAKLRQHLPCSAKSKKLSKVQILRSAIQYINQLQHILDAQEDEHRQDKASSSHGHSPTTKKEVHSEVSSSSSSSSKNSPQAFDPESSLFDEEAPEDRPAAVVSPKSLPSVTSSHLSYFGEETENRDLLEELSGWMK